MTDYQLEPNEGILLRAENVERYSAGDKEESLDEMVLTNKNIICTYEKSTGLFSPTKTVVDKRPLEFIGSANGSIQIFQVDDDDYGLGLQIVYKNGTREHYVFESTKKELSNWYSAVHNAVSLLSTTQPYSYHEDTKNETKRVFCNQCGKQVDASSKFCNECGAKIYVDSSMNDNRKSTTDRSKRQTVYEGTLHKCPNCGEILKSFTSVCPLCGHEIRDTQSTNSIMELSRKLEEIEARQMPQFQAKRSLMKTLVGKDFNNTDEEEEARQEFEEQKEQQKSNLIINFPVPNTREDILELMILSASNVNIKKGIDDDVSKAWLQKMEQVYEKAKITMGTSAEFAQIKNIYDRKKVELKNRKFKGFFIASYCVSGFLLFECFCMFMAESAKAGVILLLIAIGVLLLGVKFTSIYIKNNNKI